MLDDLPIVDFISSICYWRKTQSTCLIYFIFPPSGNSRIWSSLWEGLQMGCKQCQWQGDIYFMSVEGKVSWKGMYDHQNKIVHEK